MIANITRGRSFKGVLRYVSCKDGAEYITGNVSKDPEIAAREMGTMRQYSRCRTPVWHCSLSLSPGDRNLSNEEFAALAQKFIVKMGLTNNQYSVYRHSDKAHAHIHIIANRICMDRDTKTWNPWQDKRRAMQAKDELEREYNLKRVVCEPQFAAPSMTRGELEACKRTATIPPKQYVAQAVLRASQTGSVKGFVELLRDSGIVAKPNISRSTGKMNGFSFVYGRHHYKGSQLRCSWLELSKRLNYDPDLDNGYLMNLAEIKKQTKTAPLKKESVSKQLAIYSIGQWTQMGGEKSSDYKRVYKMLSDGLSMKSCAHELRLQNPCLTNKQIHKILMSSSKYWIERNQEKLRWAYEPRYRKSIRFDLDPAVMLAQLLALLVVAAIQASLRNIEKHNLAKRVRSLSDELKSMREYAEVTAAKKLEQLNQEGKREQEHVLQILAGQERNNIDRQR